MGHRAATDYRQTAVGNLCTVGNQVIPVQTLFPPPVAGGLISRYYFSGQIRSFGPV